MQKNLWKCIFRASRRASQSWEDCPPIPFRIFVDHITIGSLQTNSARGAQVTLSDFAENFVCTSLPINEIRKSNFSFKIAVVPEMLVYKVRSVLESCQIGVRKVTK